MASFKSILVPTDFSACSREALDLAMSLAENLRASLTILHIWEVPVFPYAGLENAMIDAMMSDRGSVIESAAREQLELLLKDVRTRAPEARAILRRGHPADEILAAIDEANPDLVVMGTHGRRGLSRALLGSVAERVVRSSARPVLTIRGGGSHEKKT